MNLRYKRLVFFLFLLGWMIVIYRFSANPAAVSDGQSLGIGKRVLDLIKPVLPALTEEQELYVMSKLNLPIRKAAHVTEYAILGGLAFLYFHTYALSWKILIMVSVLFGLVYAASDEIHQLFVPGRAGMITDVAIDGIGVLIGVFVCCYLNSRIIKK